MSRGIVLCAMQRLTPLAFLLLSALPEMTYAQFVIAKGQHLSTEGTSHEEVLASAPTPWGNIALTADGWQYDIIQDISEPDSFGMFSAQYHRIGFKVNSPLTTELHSSPALFRETHYVDPDVPIRTSAHSSIKQRADGFEVNHSINDQRQYKSDLIFSSPQALIDFRLTLMGTDSVRIGPKGEMIYQTRFGDMEEKIPESRLWQNGRWQDVTVRHLLNADGTIGFRCDIPLQPGDTLVIDPMPHRLWSTYLGGTLTDQVENIDSDEDGNMYVTGFTQSSANFATSGSYQGTIIGSVNCFLIKYSPDGQKIWGTYFGGGNGDRCYALHYHDADAVYVGATTFSQTNVVTSGAFQSTIQGADDAAIARFDSTGSLLWCTYYGGEDHDFPARIASDAAGDIVFVGHTRSSFNMATTGAFDDSFDGFENAYLTKFSQAGFPIWGTYLGNASSRANDVGVDASGNIYLCGTTNGSLGWTGNGTFQPTASGDFDGFVMKFGPTGSNIWRSYLGGTSEDDAHAIAVSPTGTSYVVIYSASTGLSTAGVYQTAPASNEDGLLIRIGPDGTRDWATYFGGNEVDYPYAVQIDAQQNITVAGMTVSLTGIATSGAFQMVNNGEYDVMLMEFDPSGQLRWGTYWGGELSDQANDMALDPRHGHILLGGITRSSTGMATPGALLGNFSGGQNDGFVARFCEPIVPQLAYQPIPACADQVFTASVIDPVPFNILQWQSGPIGATYNIGALGSGTYWPVLMSTDTNSCPFTDSLLIDVLPLPTFTIEMNVDTVRVNEPMLFNSSIQCTSYLWPGGVTSSVLPFTATDLDPVDICLSCWNASGCMDEVCMTVNPQLPIGIAAPRTEKENFSYSIFGMDGRLMASGNWKPIRTIITDFDGPAGIYVIRILTADGPEAMRFAK